MKKNQKEKIIEYHPRGLRRGPLYHFFMTEKEDTVAQLLFSFTINDASYILSQVPDKRMVAIFNEMVLIERKRFKHEDESVITQRRIDHLMKPYLSRKSSEQNRPRSRPSFINDLIHSLPLNKKRILLGQIK